MSYNPYVKYCWRWWSYWLNLPGDILQFLKRLKLYTPLIWEDNDYDFNMVLRFMRFKLKRLRTHIEGHAVLAHAEDRIAELARVDVLLRNNIEEDPDDEWSEHYNMWDTYLKGHKKCRREGEHQRIWRLSMERSERNWRNLWRHIEKYARGWWD